VLKLRGLSARIPLDGLVLARSEIRMKLNTDRIDDAVLALLLLGLHEGDRAEVVRLGCHEPAGEAG